MDDNERLTRRFERSRAHLRAVAFRILGSTSDADDAVQEAWLRLNRTDVSEVENLEGWLTTVVARVSLNMLQSRRSRREDPHGQSVPDDIVEPGDAAHPEDEVLLADSVGQAMLVVLDALTPAERLAFVLHDMFAVPYDEIAPIVGRSPAAARQLASRARRRVQGADAGVEGDRARKQEIVAAFLAASRSGQFDALLAVLDPDVVLRADLATVRMGATAEALGAAAVAQTFAGRAQGAELAVIDGVPGAIWSVAGKARVVFDFTIADDVVVAIDMLSDPETLAELELELVAS